MASPAAAAPDKAKGNGAEKAADGGGGSAGGGTAQPSSGSGQASEKAGSNTNATKNPNKPAPSSGNSSTAPSNPPPAKTTAPAKKSTTKSTVGNKNAGCNQTPYGSGGSGANTGGVYDDTCDGAASKNGNGGGGAGGKPCAGCVGKADEKNPPGQQPGGSDRNNGYECDGNKGIGKTNPAHTGCAATEPPCVPTQEDPCDPPCVPTEEDPCTTPVPECVPTADKPCTKVLDRTLTRPTGSSGPTPPGTHVLGAVFTRGSAELAFTGFGLTPALFGGLLLGLGALLTVVSRRRKVGVAV